MYHIVHSVGALFINCIMIFFLMAMAVIIFGGVYLVAMAISKPVAKLFPRKNYYVVKAVAHWVSFTLFGIALISVALRMPGF